MYIHFAFTVTPQAKKAFFIAFTAFTLSFLSGTMTIVSYVTDIFVKTGSSFSAKNSSLFIAIIQISANLVVLAIVERINRRVCKFKWINLESKCSSSWRADRNATLQFSYINELLCTFLLCRHFTFGHRYWPASVFSYWLLTVACGSINRNTNGCHRFA